jgi:hypothetical protein
MESIQFQKTEYAGQGRKCAICTSAIESSYFQLSGQTICPVCAEKAGPRLTRPSNSTVLRGLLYGAGAAVACSICYAIITMATGMELAIAAIAVGFLIGRAVRIGTNGLGGRRCQIIAVVLTYLSITTSYLPLLVKGMREHVEAKAKAGATAGASKSQQQQPNEPEVQAPEVQTKEAVSKVPSAAGLVLGLGLLLGIALISPFLGLMEGVGGLIGLAIVAFGLMQAWKQTGRPPQVLAGPYKLEENPSAG